MIFKIKLTEITKKSNQNQFFGMVRFEFRFFNKFVHSLIFTTFYSTILHWSIKGNFVITKQRVNDTKIPNKLKNYMFYTFPWSNLVYLFQPPPLSTLFISKKRWFKKGHHEFAFIPGKNCKNCNYFKM